MNSELIKQAAEAITFTTEHPDMGHVDWPDPFDAVEIAKVCLAVFEAAQKPTDDEREALRKAVSDAVYGDERVTLGTERLVENLWAAGFRRPVSPEPSAERDIEYRDSAESDNWVVAIWGASDRDVNRALAENEELGWQKFRVSDAEPQTEPTDAPTVQLMARRGGKTQALIESMLEQANERGILVEIVHPEQATDRENYAEPKHDTSCPEWCNHCTVCGVGIMYGSLCPDHYQGTDRENGSES